MPSGIPYVHHIGANLFAKNSVDELLRISNFVTIDDGYAFNYNYIKELLERGADVLVFVCDNVLSGKLLQKDIILLKVIQAKPFSFLSFGKYRFFIGFLSLKSRVRLGRMINRLLIKDNIELDSCEVGNDFVEYFLPLSLNQLRELKDKGCRIGWHTSDHKWLRSRKDILLAWADRVHLESALNSKMEGFALPYGAPFDLLDNEMNLIYDVLDCPLYLIEREMYLNLDKPSDKLMFRESADLL